MEHVHLDFALPRRPATAAGWLALLCGLVGAVAVVAWDQTYWQPLNAAGAARLRLLQAAARQTAIPRLDDARLQVEWSRARTVAEELNLPWEALFSTFEAEAAQPVALLSLEPDAGKHELVLTGEARNTAAMLAYFRSLQQQKIFSGLALHTHQVNRQDRENPIRFRVTAHWGETS